MITHKKRMTRPKLLKGLRLRLLFVPLILLASNISFAVDLNITADFKPDPHNPSNNIFKNTTPNSGFCTHKLSQCDSGNYSLLIPGLITEPRPIMAGQADRRQGAMLKAPSEWRNFDVVSSGGGLKTVAVRILGVGATYYTVPSVQSITGMANMADAHNALWSGRSWVNPPSPCTYLAESVFSPTWYSFFWRTPTNGICGKTANYDIPSFHFDGISIMYELKTPNPLDMPQGTYTGQLNYTIGPGGDFDFGDLLMPSDNALTLNFSLSVQHILDVRFPPGSERLTLIPAAGWQQWLNRGRRPEKLFANQSFQLWSSTPFKMQLQCQHTTGNQCGIQNSEGHLVPVETRVTLPPGITDSHRMPVNRLPLSTDPSFFLLGAYVGKGDAALHFEISQDSAKQMIDHAGKKYSGNVTVIWDAEI